MKKVEEYYKKTGQAVRKKKSQRKTDQLKTIDELSEIKTPPPEYKLIPL